jgi:hypothetical protein
MARRRSARFAVGTFNGWDDACEALRDLRVAGVDPETFSFLGLRTRMTGARKHNLKLRLCELTPTTAGERVCCTAGLLADRLAERVNDGAASLQEALGLWLVSRHAARVQEAVEGGCLMLWIQLIDARDERRACTILLTHCLSAVEVHDLAALPRASGQ